MTGSKTRVSRISRISTGRLEHSWAWGEDVGWVVLAFELL
jgi:hypothetical protein